MVVVFASDGLKMVVDMTMFCAHKRGSEEQDGARAQREGSRSHFRLVLLIFRHVFRVSSLVRGYCGLQRVWYSKGMTWVS
jgi:hypothetical protein